MKEKRNSSFRHLLCGFMLLALVLVLLPVASVRAEEKQTPAVQTVDVGIPVEEYPELFVPRSMPTHGEGKIAVFLIEFPDYPNENPVATREYYDKLYFSGGVKTNWGEDISVAKFYKEQSYGKLNLSGQVFDWYTAKHERSYYDDMDRKIDLVLEAMEYYQAQGVDFSKFDGDGDGVLDTVAYHFTGGETTGDTDDPWYHGVRYGLGAKYGDVLFTTIIQVYENAYDFSDLLGVVCHELMHNLGIPDLYSKYQMSYDHALIDLMSGTRNYINPYSKMMLGWVDTVTVVTGDVKNLHLEPYNEKGMGDVVIVTDEWKGFFDEYFLIAYNGEFGQHNATAWHVDARLNQWGNAFLYQNLYYTPYPDQDHPHGYTQVSSQLFIEELSADPNYNYVLKPPGSSNVAFTADSALGPNSLPSTDFHDGTYSGIHVHNFKEHNEAYLMLDVSFVTDVDKPFITKSGGELELKEKIIIPFNEFVYMGVNWDGIQVLNADGEPLEASVSLSYYPHHEIEIAFQSEDYKNGYQLLFPDNCVKDSSGNGLAAVTLTATTEKIFFPTQQVKLPNTGEYTRHNDDGFMFYQDDGVVVITNLWENLPEGNKPYRKVELMKLDLDGNVLSQIIVDNPIDHCILTNVVSTGDGGYVLFCRGENVLAGGGDMFFGIDANGNLKWINTELHNTGIEFKGNMSQYYLPVEDGVVMGIETYDAENNWYRYHLVHIDSETGSVRYLENTPFDVHRWEHNIFGLSQNKLLIYNVNGPINDMEIAIVEAENFSVVQQARIPSNGITNLKHAYLNSDGSVFLVGTTGDGNVFLLLDASLKLVKSLSWKETNNFGDDAFWFDNDGFCYVDKTLMLSHSNSEYTVYRYDRYLNFMWKTDIQANFIFYFQSSEGKIVAYRSMWSPERECYFDTYGVENTFRTTHVHDMIYVEGMRPTCAIAGLQEHWYCTGCGLYCLDDGTPITDYAQIYLPAAHHIVEVPAVAPNCVQSGNTAGSYCDICQKILENPETLPPNGAHVEADCPEIAPTCKQPGSSGGKKCAVCGLVLEKAKVVPATGAHNEVVVPGVEPTCGKTGLTYSVRCSVCKTTIVRADVLPATEKHVYGVWEVIQEPTCKAAGMEQRKCRVCNKSSERRIPALEEHSFGDWSVTKEATRTEAGEESRVCAMCGEQETRAIEKLPASAEPDSKDSSGMVVIAIAAAAAGIAAVTVILLKKKK